MGIPDVKVLGPVAYLSTLRGTCRSVVNTSDRWKSRLHRDSAQGITPDLTSAISAVRDIVKATESTEELPDLLALLPEDHHDLLQHTKHNFRKSFMHQRDEILKGRLKADVKKLHDAKKAPYGGGQNGDHFYEFLSSQVDNGISWLSPWFRRSTKARRIDDDKSVYVKVMQALFLPFPELVEKLNDPAYECPNPYCLDGACPSDASHKLSVHDPFGHFTLFGPGNKENVLGERYSSDKFIYNAVMEFVADRPKKSKA